MFRRKEDSLFDTNDSTQPQDESAVTESATPINIPQSTGNAAPSFSPARPTAAPTATSPTASATTAPTASSFRPNAAPLGGDLTRNRMPEAKPATPTATSSSPATSTISSTSSMTTSSAKSSGKRVLTVGNDILLKGEIATCDRLVIEGRVDATLNDVHTVEIAEGGSFKGSAQIEDAEISGVFEGDLVVRGRLVIYSTGKVRGKISYGEIEIERGGELSGDIKTGNQATSNRSSRIGASKDEKAAA